MGFNITLPNITAPTEQGKLEQIRSYLYQFAEQLQWALDTIDSKTETAVVQQTAKTQSVTSNDNGKQDYFTELKALIITSADIVDAYYEEINQRLSGEYVAQSVFGTYREQTDALYTQTSTGMTALFSDVQSLQSNVKGIGDKILETEAYIRYGKLDEEKNGTVIYGVEVGQEVKKDGVSTFNKYARFTSDRLSFYDNNDIEVAYISDRKLCITDIEVKYSFNMGGFVDNVDETTGDIVTKWVR